ncbi:MAG: sensor histidine kinase [Gemmatimonas sp.]
MRRLRLSLFRLEALIIALSLALLAAAVAGQIVSDHRSAMAAAVVTAETDARLITEHAKIVFRTADRMIENTIESIGDRSMDEVAIATDLPRALAEYASDLVDGGSVWIADRDGTLVISTSQSALPGTSLADRDYFRAIAAGAPYYIGPVASGLVSGSRIIVISRPIRSADGVFRGAVAVAIQARYFAEFYRSIGLGAQSSVAIVRDDGAVLAREPPASGEARARIVATMPPDLDHMVNIGPSSVDRADRIAAFRRVPGHPLIVSAALSTESVLAPWRRRSLALGGFAVIAIALLGSFGFVAVRAGSRERAALEESRKLSEELAVSLQRERMMRSELLHRTKNNLAMMIAMLNVESRRPNVDAAAFVATANRISALALAQQSLDHASATGEIDCAEYLGKIATVLANAEPHGKVRLSLALEPITLPAERAQALGLIANELMTNSIKYAFRDRPTGTVTLRLRADGDLVTFEYADDGPGFEAEARQDSKGLRLVSALCETLGARYTITGSGGVRFRLSFPRAGEARVGGPEPSVRRAAGA